MGDPGVWAACAYEWVVQMRGQRDAEQWGWGPWKEEHHGEKRNRKRRATWRNACTSKMETMGCMLQLAWTNKCNIRNCRNHLPENSMLENVRPTKYGSHASSEHTGILDPTFLSNKSSEPSTVFQDAVFLGFLSLQFWNLFPMFAFVKVILYLLKRQQSLHTFG